MATKNCYRSFLKFSKGTEVQPNTNALESSPLGRLNYKLILHIAGFLSPVSILEFSRCCRHISSIIGAHRQDPAGLWIVRSPPWEILELENPDHLECYHCQDLHPIDKLYKYADLEARSKDRWSMQHNIFSGKCREVNRKVRAARFIHPNFDFTVFRMVMKRYRQRNEYVKLLTLLSYRSGAIMEGPQVKQVIATPKIVGGRLLMHIQEAYIVPPTRTTQIYLLDRNMFKCPHTTRWSCNNTIVTKRLHQKFTVLETMNGSYQDHIMKSQCSFCPTEFNVSMEHFKGQGSVLFLNKWQDLGTGLSPLDSGLPPVVECSPNIRLAYESPRDRFEALVPGEDRLTFPALNHKDKDSLFKKSDSRLARFRRAKDSALWDIVGNGQPYPHKYAL